MAASPDRSPSPAQRIHAGLIGFACGDAAGVPWESKRPDEIDRAAIGRLPASRGWPAGSVSDDTIFLLSMARTLVAGDATPRGLLERLAADLPRARGAGRTSRAAIERFVQTGATRAEGGISNGAAMRALPLGWASAPAQVEERVRLGIELARATHGHPAAIAAAVAVAAMGTWSVAAVPRDRLLQHAVAEAGLALARLDAEPELITPLIQATAGRWRPPASGVPFEGMATVAAVITALGAAGTTEDAIIRAIALGGDTDTVAAITAGIHAAWQGGAVVPWSGRVPLPDHCDLAALAAGLAQRRAATPP